MLDIPFAFYYYQACDGPWYSRAVSSWWHPVIGWWVLTGWLKSKLGTLACSLCQHRCCYFLAVSLLHPKWLIDWGLAATVLWAIFMACARGVWNSWVTTLQSRRWLSVQLVSGVHWAQDLHRWAYFHGYIFAGKSIPFTQPGWKFLKLLGAWGFNPKTIRC